MGRGGPPRNGRQLVLGRARARPYIIMTGRGPEVFHRVSFATLAGAARRGAPFDGAPELIFASKNKKTEAVGQLVPLGSNALLRFHLRPIDVVFSHGPSHAEA